MSPVLTGLGVPGKVQAFFNASGLLFDHGGHFEQYDIGFHRVPAAGKIWQAGRELSPEVVVTYSAMEAIAYMSLNLHRYGDLDAVSFIALGNLPRPAQLSWIRGNYRKRKFTLVFGNDLLGRIADIYVAAGLKNKPAALSRSGSYIRVACNGGVYTFAQDALSLSAFEKAAGIRTGIRTSKPKRFNTYLDQLKYDANQ